MVSSSVSPVNTRMVSCFSLGVSVPQDGMSLDTGTFSGSQKFPVSRSQTSASLSSCSRFQLIAETRSISFIFSVTRTPLHLPVCLRNYRLQTLPLVSDKPVEHNKLCLRVANNFHRPAGSGTAHNAEGSISSLRIRVAVGPKIQAQDAVEEAIGQQQ